ncbi:ROK family protein [Nonomuraea dietziae]
MRHVGPIESRQPARAGPQPAGEWRGHIPCRSRREIAAGPVEGFRTDIGGCLVSGGRIYRGGRGLSGDVPHVRVADSGERECSCGSRGCLEIVASGAALARRLGERGLPVATTRDVIAATADAEPSVVTTVRHAGGLLGSPCPGRPTSSTPTPSSSAGRCPASTSPWPRPGACSTSAACRP